MYMDIDPSGLHAPLNQLMNAIASSPVRLEPGFVFCLWVRCQSIYEHAPTFIFARNIMLCWYTSSFCQLSAVTCNAYTKLPPHRCPLQATLSAAISTAAQDSLNKTPLPAPVIVELKNVLPTLLAKANDLLGSIPTFATDFNTTINSYFGSTRRGAVANQLSELVAMLESKLNDVNMVQVCVRRHSTQPSSCY